MRAFLLSLSFLTLAACTDAEPDTAPVPGAAGAAGEQVAAVPPLDPGPPDPRTTVVDDSTGVVTPDGDVLANARRLRVAGGRERVTVSGGPERFLVALRAGQQLSVEAEGGPTVSVFDPGGKPLAEGVRTWSGTVNQTADFVVEATGSGAVFVAVE